MEIGTMKVLLAIVTLALCSICIGSVVDDDEIPMPRDEMNNKNCFRWHKMSSQASASIKQEEQKRKSTTQNLHNDDSNYRKLKMAENFVDRCKICGWTPSFWPAKRRFNAEIVAWDRFQHQYDSKLKPIKNDKQIELNLDQILEEGEDEKNLRRAMPQWEEAHVVNGFNKAHWTVLTDPMISVAPATKEQLQARLNGQLTNDTIQSWLNSPGVNDIFARDMLDTWKRQTEPIESIYGLTELSSGHDKQLCLALQFRSVNKEPSRCSIVNLRSIVEFTNCWPAEIRITPTGQNLIWRMLKRVESCYTNIEHVPGRFMLDAIVAKLTENDASDAQIIDAKLNDENNEGINGINIKDRLEMTKLIMAVRQMEQQENNAPKI